MTTAFRLRSKTGMWLALAYLSIFFAVVIFVEIATRIGNADGLIGIYLFMVTWPWSDYALRLLESRGLLTTPVMELALAGCALVNAVLLYLVAATIESISANRKNS
jgi:hypothetical protein